MPVTRVAVRPPQSPPASAAVAVSAPPGRYVVKSGDTLGAIAASNQLSLRELLNANPQIANPNLIRVGQVINVPGDSFTPPAPVALVPPAPLPPPATVSAASAAAIAQVAATREIGLPVDNGGGGAVHDWDGLKVQDFSGGRDTEGRCVVVDGAAGPHLVRNDFYRNYLAGENHKALGAPLDEEHSENGAVVQHFERGMMSWTKAEGTRVQLTQAAPPAPTQPSPGSDLGQLVEGLYQSVLGRPSDPAGKANWLSFAEAQRRQGKGDAQIESTLRALFKQSDEYQRRGPAPVTGPSLPPVGAPGSVYAPYEVAPGATVNGRLGADWPAGAPVDDTIAKMKALGVRYTCILSPDASPDTVAKLLKAGITPAVRLYLGTSPADWSPQDIQQMAAQAKAFSAMGVKLIQVGNEPNHAQESHANQNQSWDWDGYERRSIDNQVAALKAVKNAVGGGAAVGLPPMAPGTPDRQEWAKGYYGSHPYFEKLVDAIGAAERADGRAYVDWVPTHTYAAAPGETTLADYDWYAQTASEKLGRPLRALSTEGGAHPSTWRTGDPVGLLSQQVASMEANSSRTTCLWLQWAPNFDGSDGWEKQNVFQNDPPERTRQMLDWLRAHAPG